jgi:hypothetical protein
MRFPRLSAKYFALLDERKVHHWAGADTNADERQYSTTAPARQDGWAAGIGFRIFTAEDAEGREKNPSSGTSTFKKELGSRR